MSLHSIGIRMFAVAAVVAVAGISQAGGKRTTVQGRFTAVAVDGAARGRFSMTSKLFEDGSIAERIDLDCRKLDATKTESKRPEYHLWLVRADASASADMGKLRINPQGHAWMHFNSRLDAYPEGVDLIADFGGGTAEVRLGDTAVLTGAIPAFDGSGAVGVSHDTNRLEHPENGRGRGWIEARTVNRPKGGTAEVLRIQIVGLARSMGPYTAVAISGEGDAAVETNLATLLPHGRYGQDKQVYDTRKGDTMPGGGSVTAFVGQHVEIRDKDGAVVLSSEFPTVTDTSGDSD